MSTLRTEKERFNALMKIARDTQKFAKTKLSKAQFKKLLKSIRKDRNKKLKD